MTGVSAPPSRLALARQAMSLSKRGQLESLLMPAGKAYLLGYVLDILPAILKVVLRYIGLELKRIRASEKRLLEERRVAREQKGSRGTSRSSSSLWQSAKIVAPSFYQIPDLLRAILSACVQALGPSGMAVSCFLAMAGWRISESLVWWPIAKYYALKLSSGATETTTLRLLGRARVMSTFVAASLSSAMAMMILQHQTRTLAMAKFAPPTIKTLPADPNDMAQAQSRWMPRALRPSRSSLGFWSRSAATSKQSASRFASLAPAGHFLSRLTSLSIPSTPRPLTNTHAPSSTSPLLPASPTRSVSPLPPVPAQMSAPPPSALGKPSPTIDLTLFALVRGLDTLVRALTSSGPAQRNPATAKSAPTTLLQTVTAGVRNQAEGLIFVVCCAQIMWAWFYHPERLPPSYVKWITNLATMDERLLLALRSIRRSEPLRWNYQLTDMTPEGVHLLGSLAEELGHPYEWGDPTRLPNTTVEARAMITEARRKNEQMRKEGKEVVQDAHRENGKVPGFVLNGAAGPRGRGEMAGMPCELVHCGVGGASCYRNALLRWIRGWRMSMAIYFPVHLLPRLLFNPKGFFRSPLSNLIKVLLGAARSAAFLATFIVGNWFPICLGRTALLPRLMPGVSFRYWDGGLGPRMGSIACGFSIFIEEKRKRAEMALYVAPRALFAMAESAQPGWLSQGKPSALWAERVVFGSAVGTIVAAARYRPDLLRGITATMGWVTRPIGQQSSHRNYARSQS